MNYLGHQRTEAPPIFWPAQTYMKAVLYIFMPLSRWSTPLEEDAAISCSLRSGAVGHYYAKAQAALSALLLYSEL